ncbi:MAG TPA: PilZ domain-containing protein [Candidatus Limnocylindrales bacterium]|nr:PilZ domain-containing protein [Candidatus Limnocylindrales bacterium]
MMDQERRRTPRYMFFASAELLEEKSEVRIATHVSELSRNGCYLDMMNPFPTHTVVRVKIWTEENVLIETKALVVYSQPNRGAGLAFVDFEQKYMPQLEKWLEKAKQES